MKNTRKAFENVEMNAEIIRNSADRGTRRVKTDDAETLHRKARLRELIRVAFGTQAALLRHINQRRKPEEGAQSQAELNQLTKDNNNRAFGDQKGKKLAEDIGLHRRWFEMPLGTNLDRSQWLDPAPTADQKARPAVVPALPPSPISPDAVIRSIAAIAELAGISLETIIPSVETARKRIAVALGKPPADSTKDRRATVSICPPSLIRRPRS